MTMPVKIAAELYFSDYEPCIIGHLQIGHTHYEIAGIRRSLVRTDITGRKIETQGDLSDENVSRSGDR